MWASASKKRASGRFCKGCYVRGFVLTVIGLESSWTSIKDGQHGLEVLGKFYGPPACDRFVFWCRNLGFAGAFCGGRNSISGSGRWTATWGRWCKSAFMVDEVVSIPWLWVLVERLLECDFSPLDQGFLAIEWSLCLLIGLGICFTEASRWVPMFRSRIRDRTKIENRLCRQKPPLFHPSLMYI